MPGWHRYGVPGVDRSSGGCRSRCGADYLAVPTAPIDERDIAAVAVRTLCEDGHSCAEYVLTGPQSLSQFEQIATIGSVLGRSLRIEEISPDRLREVGEEQPDVFMERAVRLGIEPKVAKRIGLRREDLETRKQAEIERIVSGFKKFKAGQADVPVVDADRIKADLT